MLSQKIIIYPSTAAQGQPNGDRSQGGTSMRPHSDSCRSGGRCPCSPACKAASNPCSARTRSSGSRPDRPCPPPAGGKSTRLPHPPAQATGQETRRSNGAAQRSQTACRFVEITASKTRTPAVLRTVPSAETGSCTGKLPPNCRSCRSSAVWKGRTLSGFCMIFDNPSSIMIPCSIVVQEIL